MLRKAFPILALSTFCSMLGMGIISPLIPVYATSLGATAAAVGLIFAGFSIGRAVLSPVIGYWSDRIGRKPFIVIGLLASSLVSLAYIWADSVPELIIVRLVHGAAGGIVFPVTQAYVGDISPHGKEGTWMGYYTASFFTAFAVGPLLGGILGDRLGPSAAFYTMSGLTFLGFLVSLVFLPEVKNRQARSTMPRPSFAKMGQSGIVRGLFSYRLGTEMGWGIFFCFLPIITGINLGMSSTQTGVLLTANMLITSVLMIPFGRLTDRFDRRWMVIIGGAMGFIQMAFTGFATEFWQLLVLVSFGGIGGAITSPAGSALSVEEGRKFGMATTITVITMAMSIGVAVGPIAGGALADVSDVVSAFYFAAALSLIGISLFAWFSRKRDR
jgi:MFS family permease